jgi:hypothetical protein
MNKSDIATFHEQVIGSLVHMCKLGPDTEISLQKAIYNYEVNKFPTWSLG